MCGEKIYQVSDPLALIRHIQAEGGPIMSEASQGSVEYKGVHFTYVIVDKSITITLVDKPFFTTCDYIWGQLDKFMETA